VLYKKSVGNVFRSLKMTSYMGYNSKIRGIGGSI